MQDYTYTITKNSILVTFEDGTTRTVPSENKKQFDAVIEGLRAQVPAEELIQLMDGREYIKHWACGAFIINDNKLIWVEHPEFEVPECLAAQVREFAANDWPAESFCKFLRMLLQNPSKRSIETFYQFIKEQGLTIDADGYVIGYKSIRPDWTDWHTGTVNNCPGQQPTMARSKVDDDPANECSTGFHFGGSHYARTFGGCHKRIIAVRVNPTDLVCVPHDCNFGKVRVCTYLSLREIPQTGTFKPYYEAGFVGDDETNELPTELTDDNECENCGSAYEPGDQFCRICGQPLPEKAEDEDEEFTQCPKCGNKSIFDDDGDLMNYCPDCGCALC